MAKKKGSRKSKGEPEDDVSKKLYDWIAEGYVVDELVEAVKSKDTKTIDKLFGEYESNIERVEKLKGELEKLKQVRGALNTKSPLYIQLMEIIKHPAKVDVAEKYMVSLKSGPKLKELEAELASLNVTGFEEEAKAIKAKFADTSRADEIERDIRSLTRRIKEKFFAESFESVIVPTEEPKKSFKAETIFLLHRDGTLLSVKSRKPPRELDKKLMSKMVMAIREQMSRAFKEGQHVHSLRYEEHTIILEDSVHVYAAVMISGEVRPVMYKIILKALQILEKHFAGAFDNWTGDRSSLKNMDKYTSAMFQALDKLK
jgi:hypothetical protein